MIITNINPEHFIITGGFGTVPASDSVSGATMSTDTVNRAVLHVEGWPYTYQETLALGEFYIFNESLGQLALVKSFREEEIVGNNIDLFLDKAFAQAITDEDVFIILPRNHRGNTRFSIVNLGLGVVGVGNGGIVGPGESHLYEAQNSYLKPMVIDATNSNVYATTAEISSGVGLASGSNYELVSEEFTDEETFSVTHNLGFPTTFIVDVAPTFKSISASIIPMPVQVSNASAPIVVSDQIA